MTRRTRKVGAWLLALSASYLGLRYALHRSFPKFAPTPNDALFFPRPELFRAASLGFTQLAADLLWFDLVQSLGDWRSRTSPEGYRYLHRYAELVTDVDPDNAAAYLISNFWLTAWGQVDKANAMLEKGWRHFEHDPQAQATLYKFPYYIGLNQFVWKRDKKAAVEYFGKAIELRAPAEQRAVVERATQSGLDPEAAFDVMKEFYLGVRDPAERKAMQPLMRHGAYYNIATKVNQVIARYRAEHDDRVPSLEDLVAAGYLGGIPQDPYEGRLYVDAEGRLRSTKEVNGYWWERNLRAERGAAATPDSPDAPDATGSTAPDGTAPSGAEGEETAA